MTGARLLGLAGTVTLKVRGAYPEDFLSALAARDIRPLRLRRVDELTVQITLLARDVSGLRACAKRTMCSVELVRVSGLFPFVRAMGIRACYPVLLSLLAALVFWLQGHLMFFSVSGNTTIPDGKILSALEEHGVGFWTKTDTLDMNLLKNAVLAEVPELSWITINTDGGFAEVIVRERAEKPVISRSSAPANVVAKKPGLITEVSVTGGTAQVAQNDVVQTGDLLISGVTDLEKTLLLTRAEGEIYARTWNRMGAVLPDNARTKAYTGRQKYQYRLTLGKKTINFFKTSGISYGEYDKIIENHVLTLPGGYAFPVALTRTVLREYVSEPASWEAETARALLEDAAEAQLRRSMIAGQIIACRTSLRETAQGWLLSGTAECQEEIGITEEMKG